MKKINLAITGCMGRMGQQFIKSVKSDKNFNLVALTENRIINKKTGISIMKINEKLDEGDVSKIFKLNILENENAQSLSERLSVLASDKITDIIDNIFEGNVNYRAQEHSNATYAKKK